MIVFSTITRSAGAVPQGELAALPQEPQGDCELQGALYTSPHPRHPCRPPANAWLVLESSSPSTITIEQHFVFRFIVHFPPFDRANQNLPQ
jgi:hypothetical protein